LHVTIGKEVYLRRRYGIVDEYVPRIRFIPERYGDQLYPGMNLSETTDERLCIVGATVGDHIDLYGMGCACPYNIFRAPDDVRRFVVGENSNRPWPISCITYMSIGHENDYRLRQGTCVKRLKISSYW
jgi:hypothetical protein